MLPDLGDMGPLDRLDTDAIGAVCSHALARCSVLSPDGGHQSVLVVQIDTVEGDRSWFAFHPTEAAVFASDVLSLLPEGD